MRFGQHLLFAALRPVSVLPVAPLTGSVTVMTHSAPTTRKHLALCPDSDISAVVTLARFAQKIKHQRVGPIHGQCARLLLVKVRLGKRPTRVLVQHRSHILHTHQILF